MADEVFFKKIQQTQVQFLCSKMDYSKNPRGIILSSPTLVGQLEKNLNCPTSVGLRSQKIFNFAD
jgi:hypothetical protein